MILYILLQAQPTSETWDSPNKLLPIIIGAILGSALTFGIGRFIIYCENRIKEREIRKLIVSDLKRQILPLARLREEVLELSEYFGEIAATGVVHDEGHMFTLNRGLQTDTFKSQTRMDFFNSFDEGDFHILMEIYFAIRILEAINPLNIKNALIETHADMVKEGKDPKIIENYVGGEYNMLRGYELGASKATRQINQLIENTTTKYNNKNLLIYFMPYILLILSLVIMVGFVLWRY